MFSYGSGAVGEFFTAILEEGYKSQLAIETHKSLFDSRQQISVADYETIFSQQLPQDGSEVVVETKEDPSKICLAGIKDHKRFYLVK